MSRGSSTLDAVQMDLFEGRGPAGDARSGKDRRAATVPEPRPGSWPAFTRALAETLAEADFARTFFHPERGVVRLDSNLAMYAWHGRHHEAHILGLRERMGWK